MHRYISLILILFASIGKIKQQQFQPELALHLLYTASASYCIADTIIDFSCPPCKNITNHKFYNMTISKTIENQPQKVIYLYNEAIKEFVISFEGTHNPYQIEHQILNSYGMTYPLKDLPNAIVGSYFMKGYDLFRQSVRLNLESIQKKYGYGISFIFTGHSLGGAFAVLAAFDAVSQNWIKRSVNDDGKVTNPKIYTFGQPRLGNHPLAQAIDQSLTGSYFRVTHQRDMIPHLPPCVPSFQSGQQQNDIREACVQGTGTFAMFYPYHSGTEVFFNEANTEFQICTPGVEDGQCSDQFNVYSISDHFYYMGVLDNCPGDGDQ